MHSPLNNTESPHYSDSYAGTAEDAAQHGYEHEEEAFVHKIRTLKDCTLDLSRVLHEQNARFKDIEPDATGTLLRIRSALRNLNAIDARWFRGWLYYTVTTLFLLFILFIFFFVF